MKSINPKKIDPTSTLFRISAADLAFVMSSHGYTLDNMDPHVWAKVKQAVEARMSSIWAEEVAEAVEVALRD